MAQLFLNFGYALMLIALSFHDILWLRVVLISAQLNLVAYAVVANNSSMAFWNFLFAAINCFQIFRLTGYQNPTKILPQYDDIYQNSFQIMSKREFFSFWKMGTEKEVYDDIIIREGETQIGFLLILSGSAEVVRNGKVMEQLSRGCLVSNSSIFHEVSVPVDIKTNGQVGFISWEAEKLKRLRRKNPQLLIKIQDILYNDLAGKLKQGLQ